MAKSTLWKGPEEQPGVSSSKVSKKQTLRVQASQNSLLLTNNADTSDSSASLQKKSLQKLSFPNGFQILVEEVCDHTDIAEVKLKVRDYEMHLKRDIGISKPPNSLSAFIESLTTAPPIPSRPMQESVHSPAPTVEQKSSASGSSSPFNSSTAKTSKLAVLEALGQNAFVLMPSPVGSFRRGRTLKGKRQPPSCKEGDIIKEGQIIGFLDQFGNELPVRSDIAGEVLRILYNDGEPVGYGDPLAAVLPAFHGIK